MGSSINDVFDRIKGDKRIVLIVILGLCGVLLLTLSELLPERRDAEDGIEEQNIRTDNLTEYEKVLENRLSELLSAVNGAGKVKVMLTLDCGDENIYATEIKSGSSTEERKYVLIEENGEDSGLLLKTDLPQVRGVAVVCEGADSSEVRQEITGLLTAVLGVSTNRVNIAKMKSGYGG